MVLAALVHFVPLGWPALKSGGGLGKWLDNEMAAMETGGSGSPWRPCHVPGLRCGVSCGRAGWVFGGVVFSQLSGGNEIGQISAIASGWKDILTPTPP
jgi:hypothetical protein